MNYASLLRGLCFRILLWLGPVLGCVSALGQNCDYYFNFHNDTASNGAFYVPSACGNWQRSVNAGQTVNWNNDCLVSYGSGFTIRWESPIGTVIWSQSFTVPSTPTDTRDWYASNPSPNTNVVAITCFKWTNASPSKVAVPVVQMRDSSGLWTESAADEWSGQVVWPKGVISGCITNTGLSPNGVPWCGTAGSGDLRIWDSRKPLGDPGSGEVQFLSSSCVTNGVNTVTNGVSVLTNQPGAVWPEATNIFGSLPADSTNAVTKGDIVSLGNIVVGAGASIEKAVGDTGTNVLLVALGLDTLNGTTAGIRTNTAATTNALGTVNQSLGMLNTNVAALTAAIAPSGPVPTNGVPNGYGFSTGQVNGWIGGYGTNASFYADLAQGTMNALGGGTNHPLQGLANGFENGTGTNGVGVDAVGLNTVAPGGSWGIIPICYWGGDLISLDVAAALRMDFGSVFGIGDLSWFQASVRSLALWATVIGAIILLSFDLQAAMLRVLAVPQLPNYDAQIAGTTIPGANEAIKVVKVALIAVFLAMLPSIVVAVISTISSYFAVGGGDIAAGVVGGGLGSVKDSAGVPADVNNVLWSFNQWLPLVEEIIVITNYIICEVLLILQVGIAALAVKAL